MVKRRRGIKRNLAVKLSIPDYETHLGLRHSPPQGNFYPPGRAPPRRPFCATAMPFSGSMQVSARPAASSSTLRNAFAAAAVQRTAWNPSAFPIAEQGCSPTRSTT
jgi:hypothetical protein